MGRGVHGHGRGSADLRWRDAPPIFFGLAKENGPCTAQKKNAFRPNLPIRASLGMRTADSQLSADLPSSIQVRCNAPVHPRLCRKLRRNISFQGACQCVQLLFPLPLRGDGFQRKGPQPLPSGRLGKGSRGKPSRKGFPLASLWGRPVSLGERNGSHMPTSIEVSPILRGCLLSFLKIPARRSLCPAHLAPGLDAMSVVNGGIPPPALDVMPPKMLARTAGFFHFLSPPNAIIH